MNRATRRRLMREGLMCEHGYPVKTDGTGNPVCPHKCGFKGIEPHGYSPVKVGLPAAKYKCHICGLGRRRCEETYGVPR